MEGNYGCVVHGANLNKFYSLWQHTIEIYFSYHPAPKHLGYEHLPAFSAIKPHQVVELPDLRIATPVEAGDVLGQKRPSLHDELLQTYSTRSRFVSGLKSMLPSPSVADAVSGKLSHFIDIKRVLNHQRSSWLGVFTKVKQYFSG